jgi:hypothetical protein
LALDVSLKESHSPAQSCPTCFIAKPVTHFQLIVL